MEKTYEEAIHNIAREVADLVIKKHKDYGPKNILNCPVGPEIGVLVRMYDKIARLSNLIRTNTSPQNESIEDTWNDIIGYGFIALLLRRGLFELPLEHERN